MRPQSTTSRLQFVRVCDCGCGRPTPLATITKARRGHVAGQPQPFYGRHRRRMGKDQEQRNRRINDHGYVEVYAPEHARPGKDGWALEHRVVAAEMLGRPLTSEECVHHKSRDRTDNRRENLLVLTRSEHGLLHREDAPPPQRRLTGWALKHAACTACGTTARRHWARGLCAQCYEQARDRRKRP